MSLEIHSKMYLLRGSKPKNVNSKILPSQIQNLSRINLSIKLSIFADNIWKAWAGCSLSFSLKYNSKKEK